MPIYEYLCDSCHERTELLQKLGDAPATVCPSCGGALRKLVSAPAFQFKGSGWYLTDYAKKSFEQSTATVEKLVGAKTLDKAIEIHTDYLKNAYEGFVVQSTKIGELYAGVAKEAFKPYERLAARPAGAK